MNTKAFIPAVTEVKGTHMVEIVNNMIKTPNFWLLMVGTFLIWAMTRYLPELVSNGNYRKR